MDHEVSRLVISLPSFFLSLNILLRTLFSDFESLC
jgi:hypothetical protein